MSDKHDAMWGVDTGAYIAQQEAEIVRLRALLEQIGRTARDMRFGALEMKEDNNKLRAALEQLMTDYAALANEQDK
jgi:hypothetical protein